MKSTRHGARPAQPSSSRALDTRRLASAGPSPARTAPCAPCAARRAHHSPTEPEESQQRYKDPLPGGARPAGTRHGAPAPCRVAAPRTAGLRGRATLPHLQLGPSSPRSVRVLRPRPSSTGAVRLAMREFCDLAPASTGAVRLALGRSPVPGGAHPGEASTASETRGSASSVLGTDIAGIPYPRVPSLLGLLWRCTPAHRLTGSPAHLDLDWDARKAFLQHKHNRRTRPAPLHAPLRRVAHRTLRRSCDAHPTMCAKP